MQVIEKKQELIKLINKLKKDGKSIGLVPTMGALHEGHLSLVSKCVNENDICIASIFVNPTQFNNPKDLQTYPRDLDKDVNNLASAKCNYVFAPNAEEIYPEPDTRVFDFGYIDSVMEGANRPGHFNGVGQIVSKLFEIVSPNRAYFGMKDFQQVAVINKLVEIISSDVEIVKCPIIREDDGLAKSSRNMLLKDEYRKNAPLIHATLTKAVTFAGEKTVQEVKNWVIKEINSDPLFTVEYFEIVDDTELTPVTDWNANKSIVGCITVQAGNVRLIDNITFK
jgi:pantoate--beta-alanine ligase